MTRYDVEADGGSRGNPGPAGYGAVVLDPVSGETLAEVAEYLGVATNNVAEYRGLIAALRAAHALDPDAEIRVRMDSRLVVEQMSGRWQIKNAELRALAEEAAGVFPRERVAYEWIPRERNRHADRLANEAMDAGTRGERWDPSASTAALDAGSVAVTSSASAPAVGWGSAPDLGAPTTFVLLRHGETALTPEKRFSGSGGGDPELSAEGRRQAAAVAASLAARGTIQDIVCSPLLRCRETAGAVAERLGLGVTVEDGLRETDFGAWEGLTFAEVRERYPDDMAAWLASPEAAPTGGGESFVTVGVRVEAARRRLVERFAGRTVLVVTHVTPIKTLVRLALGAPPASMFRMELSAAATSVVAYYADGNASVRLFNDTSYLG
ncbi:bifunctional RNase H/acid phosphatase [Streptomyces sp. NBC_01497]|uniref:bifunctional RNase H/acid phosphatase n=1 Tax=Streptomyces sp. NBC_01497 TaxID=2903885 RepID=UPI002E32DF2C|nr:bifunctional RNase H/acid phosphatase [Streptomyces sp. NBC_01497]